MAAPSTPTNVRATVIDHDSIRLSWDRPDGANNYRVQRRRSGTTSWSSSETFGNHSSFTWNGLSPNTTYQMRVRAQNADGNSNYSSAVSATTENLVPAILPTNVTLTVLGEDEIEVSWGTSGGLSYDVRWKENSQDDSEYTLESGVGSPPYILGGLTVNTEYDIQVRSRSSTSTSNWTTVESATTSSGVPGRIYFNDTTLSSSSSYTLSWNAPDDNGGSAITGYQIRRGAPSVLPGAWNGLQATVTSLQRSAFGGSITYDEVRAVNANGAGPGSRFYFLLNTRVHSPDDIKNLIITPGDEQITLAWDAPQFTGDDSPPESDPVYQYRYRDADSQPTWSNISYINAGFVTTVTVTGLTNGTEYEFELRVVNGQDARILGTTLNFNTTPGAPPQAPTVSNSDVTYERATISWDEPTSDLDIISYDLQWRRSADTDWILVEDVTSPYILMPLDGVTEYIVEIRANSASGNGTWGRTTFTTNPPPIVEISANAPFAPAASRVTPNKLFPGKQIAMVAVNAAGLLSDIEVNVLPSPIEVNILTPSQRVEGGEVVQLHAEVIANSTVGYKWRAETA